VGYSIRKSEERSATIARVVLAEYAKGTPLATVRKLLATGPLGGTPSLYLGTADPIYYRAAGLSRPLAKTAAKSPAALAAAIRSRRDEGVRWETVAASAEAVLGRRVSVEEAKRLYAKGGGDLLSSYAGRGTRRGAPKTYADLAAAPEAATGKPKPKPKVRKAKS
jgi:hypothetical protein